MNPFPTRQAAEAYLSRIGDPDVRAATRARLGLDLSEPEPRAVPEQLAESPREAPSFLPVVLQAASINSQECPATLSFTLPFPPSLNSIWRAVVITLKGKPQARVLLSEEGRAYRRAVRAVLHSLGNPTTPPGARLALHLHACPPDRRTRDLSNLPKALEDALTHAGVWADDSLIDELRVTRGPVTTGGQVHVTITPLTATLFEVQS